MPRFFIVQREERNDGCALFLSSDARDEPPLEGEEGERKGGGWVASESREKETDLFTATPRTRTIRKRRTLTFISGGPVHALPSIGPAGPVLRRSMKKMSSSGCKMPPLQGR